MLTHEEKLETARQLEAGKITAYGANLKWGSLGKRRDKG